MSEFGRMYKNALTWGVLAAGLLFRGALAAMDALYRGGSFWQRAAGFWDGTGSVALAALVLLALIHVFSADRETMAEELVLTTPFGRGRLFARRIAAAALAAVTGALILAAGNLALSALLSSEPMPEGWLSGYARTSLTAVLGAVLYAVFAGVPCGRAGGAGLLRQHHRRGLERGNAPGAGRGLHSADARQGARRKRGALGCLVRAAAHGRSGLGT